MLFMRKNIPQHQNSITSNSNNTNSYYSLSRKLQQQDQAQQSTHRLSQVPSTTKLPSENVTKSIAHSLHSPQENHEINYISLNSKQQNQQNIMPLSSRISGSYLNQASSSSSSGITSQSSHGILTQQYSSAPVVKYMIPEQRLSSCSFQLKESQLVSQAQGGANNGESINGTSSSSYLNQYKVQQNSKQSQKSQHQSNGNSLSKKNSQISIFHDNKNTQSLVQQGELIEQAFKLSQAVKQKTQPHQQSLSQHSYQKNQQQYQQQQNNVQLNSSEIIIPNVTTFKNQTDLDWFHKGHELSLHQYHQSQNILNSESQLYNESQQTISDQVSFQKQEIQSNQMIPSTDSKLCKNQTIQSQQRISFSQLQETSIIKEQSSKKTINQVIQSSKNNYQKNKPHEPNLQKPKELSKNAQLKLNQQPKQVFDSQVTFLFQNNLQDNHNGILLSEDSTTCEIKPNNQEKRVFQQDILRESESNGSQKHYSGNQPQFQRQTKQIDFNASSQLLSEDQDNSSSPQPLKQAEIDNFDTKNHSFNSGNALQQKCELQSFSKSISPSQLYQINNNQNKISQSQTKRTTILTPNKEIKSIKTAQVIETIQRKGATNNTLPKKTRTQFIESQHFQSRDQNQQKNNSIFLNSLRESTEKNSQYNSQSCSRISDDQQSILISPRNNQISNRNYTNNKHERLSQNVMSSSMLQQLSSSHQTDQLEKQKGQSVHSKNDSSFQGLSKMKMQKNSKLPLNQPSKQVFIDQLEDQKKLKQEQDQLNTIQYHKQQGTTFQSLDKGDLTNHKESSLNQGGKQNYVESSKLTLKPRGYQTLNKDISQKSISIVSDQSKQKDSKPKSAITTSVQNKKMQQSTSVVSESARDSCQRSNMKIIKNSSLSSKEIIQLNISSNKQSFSTESALPQQSGENGLVESNTVRDTNKTTQYSSIPSSQFLNCVGNENDQILVNKTVNHISSIKPTVPPPSFREQKDGSAQKKDRNSFIENFLGLKMKSSQTAQNSKNHTQNYQKTGQQLLKEKQEQIQYGLNSKRDESFSLIRQVQNLSQQPLAETSLEEVNMKNSPFYQLQVLSNDDSYQQMQEKQKSSNCISGLPKNQAMSISKTQNCQIREKQDHPNKKQLHELKINTSNTKDLDKKPTLQGGIGDSAHKNITTLIKPSKIISYIQQLKQQSQPHQLYQQIQQKREQLKSDIKAQYDLVQGQQSRNQFNSLQIQQGQQSQLNKQSEMNTIDISEKTIQAIPKQDNPSFPNRMYDYYDENQRHQSNILRKSIGQQYCNNIRQQQEDEKQIQGLIESEIGKDSNKRQDEINFTTIGQYVQSKDKNVSQQIRATNDSFKIDKLLQNLELVNQTQHKQVQQFTAISADNCSSQIQKSKEFGVTSPFIQQSQTIQQRQQLDLSSSTPMKDINIQLIQTIQSDHHHKIQTLASNNYSNLLFTGSQDYNLRIYHHNPDERTLELRQSIRHRKAVTCLSLMPQRNDSTQLLLSGCADGIIRVFNEEQRNDSMNNHKFNRFYESQFIKSHNSGISSLLGINGTHGISGSLDGDVSLWDLQKVQSQNCFQESIISKFRFKQGISSIHQLTQEHEFLVLTNQCVYLIDTRISSKPQEITQNSNSQLNFTALSTIPNRNQFILSSHSDNDGSACLELNDLRFQQPISKRIINKIASSAKQIKIIDQVAIYITDSQICSVRIDNFNQTARILTDNITQQISLEINNLNSKIYTGSRDHVLRVFEFKND